MECAPGLNRLAPFAAVLADSRLVVVEPDAPRVVIVNCDRPSISQLGGKGAGPGEYLLPAAIAATRDGGLLLLDRSTGRATRWNGQLELVGSTAIPLELVRFDVRLDGDGRVYFTDPPATSPLYLSPADRTGRAPDSSLVYRRDLEIGSVDTLGSVVIPGAEWIGKVGKFPRRFDPQDLWGIADNGTLWVARSQQLKVDLLLADGRWVTGPNNEWVPVPTGPADVRMMRNPAGAAPDSIPWPMAATKPAFSAAVSGPEGSVWVAMSHPGGHPVQEYRVFDSTGGLRAETYVFAVGSRVIAVGRDMLFTATTDDVGFTRIHRYPRPDL